MWPTDAGRWNSFDDPQRQDVMPTGNTDWLKTLFGNSFTHEHSLSVNGGTDNSQKDNIVFYPFHHLLQKSMRT